MTSVFIVGGNGKASPYSTMFERQGWTVASSIKDADLVQFIGGEDVSPTMYSQGFHPKTTTNRRRDILETAVYQACARHAIPMAGICRGAQLINVLQGGSLWQHVNNHVNWQGHAVFDEMENFSFKAPSLHHQMMRPGKDAFILCSAKQSTTREGALKDGTPTEWKQARPFQDDVEACVYFSPAPMLCFQPHPEKAYSNGAEDIYFYYLKEYIGVEKGQ